MCWALSPCTRLCAEKKIRVHPAWYVQLHQGGQTRAGSGLAWSKLQGDDNLLWKRCRWLRSGSAAESKAGACYPSSERISPSYQREEIMPISSSLLVACNVFLTPRRVWRWKRPRGEKKICTYIYIYIYVLEYLLPFIMRVFSGVLNAIFGAEDSDSTWREAGRTFFSSSLERARCL